MPSNVSTELSRHQSWLDDHEKRVRSLELSRAKFLGAMLGVSFLGSVIGSGIVLAVSHFWK